MKRVHHTICPICKSTQIVPFLQGKDYFASKESFEIVQCKACGFLFTDSFPSEDEIAPYYKASDYISHSDSRRGLVNKLYHYARSYMLNRKAHMVEQYAQKGILLDIGCGTGYFAGKMKERGWNVEAIEKDEQARKFAIESFGINVHESDMLFHLSEKKYDVVTLWHVLEHLEHLNETMDQLFSILKDNGKLVIALPNSMSYDAHKYGSYWAAYDLPRHLWHFNPHTFIQLASNHNFKMVKTHPLLLDVFYISMLSEKYKGSALGLLRALFWGSLGWFKSLFDMKETSSLVYILEKK